MLRINCVVALSIGSLLMVSRGTPAQVRASSPGVNGPYALRCESMDDALGIDAAHPMLSWRLKDGTRGAVQSSYEISVFSHPPAPAEKPDMWDSGKIASRRSLSISYNGEPLQPSTRYFWRVKIWDQSGRPYPVSRTAWWETGMMGQANWKSQWIGYESAELHALRNSGAKWISNVSEKVPSPDDTHHSFRDRFDVNKAVKSAVLFAAGEDTAAAWVNGRQVLEWEPLGPSKQMPWAKYRRTDVTREVVQGSNVLAVDVVRYLLQGQTSVPSQTAMSACLFLTFSDGSTHLVSTAGDGWKATLHPQEMWWLPGFDDGSWKKAVAYVREDKQAPDTYGAPWPTGPVMALRRSFEEASPVVSARLYATALGAYKVWLNGQPVGADVLSPGWMDFRQHVAYQTYDVTPQIKQGGNAIAAYLAPGWYTTPLRWFQEGNNYGNTPPSFRAELRLQHADGSVNWVRTDESWKAAPSPIQKAEIYDGETVDATQRIDGWDVAGFNDSTWAPVALVKPIEPVLEAQYFPPIRQHQVLKAVSITSPLKDVYILDFGQNMSAVPRLSVAGQHGDVITLRFGELLNPDGTLYVDNLRTAKATDTFILNGPAQQGGNEAFQPLFTYHGFRYAEVRGLRSAPTVDTLMAVVLHTDAAFSSRLSTGLPMVNKLWSNILWGQRSNFVGVPTDCPQRDERLGWSADAQVFWRTAAYNMDLGTFSRKFSADLRGTQVGTPMYGIYAPGIDVANPGYGAAWSDAGVIIPWTAWVQTGERNVIEENWDGMQRYLAEIEKKNPDHLWRTGVGAPFGDWLTPTITTPEDLLATAYWAYDVSLMRQMAVASGRDQDAASYGQLFEKIRTAFQQTYVHADAMVAATNAYPSLDPPTIHPRSGSSDKDTLIETQTGYVLALKMKLIPEALRGRAAQRLVTMIEQNHGMLGTGFLGTPYLLEVLADNGHSKTAYDLLLNRRYPSWGYLVDHGATTTWERWNGDAMMQDPAMNSYNHYAYGAVGEWLYRYAAGIDAEVEAPGFERIHLRPHFDARLGKLRFEYDSVYGTAVSSWTIQRKQITWEVTIPANTSAELSSADTNATDFRLNGIPLDKVTRFASKTPGIWLIPAGTYRFTSTLVEGL